MTTNYRYQVWFIFPDAEGKERVSREYRVNAKNTLEACRSAVALITPVERESMIGWMGNIVGGDPKSRYDPIINARGTVMDLLL